MAFCNKIGGLLKQSVSQNGYMFNSSRCMSSRKLFVGGLSYGTDDEALRDAFSSFGDVSSARVIKDNDTGRSRGFGFVEFESIELASSAQTAMDGQELHGRNIRVTYATERSNNPRQSNNSYQGGGGYGNSPRRSNNNYQGGGGYDNNPRQFNNNYQGGGGYGNESY